MASRKKTGNVRAGAAGHSGHDRQPAGDEVGKTACGTPDAQEAACAQEVRDRSDEARGMKKIKHERSDMVHPGPDREEGEKSKGDALHDQHESEKEMKAEEL